MAGDLQLSLEAGRWDRFQKERDMVCFQGWGLVAAVGVIHPVAN